jgi:hypothetical protein
MKVLWIISVGFDLTDQLRIGFFALVRYWGKFWSTIIPYITNFEKAYDSIRREVLYNTFIKFGCS